MEGEGEWVTVKVPDTLSEAVLHMVRVAVTERVEVMEEVMVFVLVEVFEEVVEGEKVGVLTPEAERRTEMEEVRVGRRGEREGPRDLEGERVGRGGEAVGVTDRVGEREEEGEWVEDTLLPALVRLPRMLPLGVGVGD